MTYKCIKPPIIISEEASKSIFQQPKNFLEVIKYSGINVPTKIFPTQNK